MIILSKWTINNTMLKLSEVEMDAESCAVPHMLLPTQIL